MALEIVCDSSITSITTRQESSAQSLDISSSKPSNSSILTRIHAGYFSIALSLAAQALLWKVLSEPKIANNASKHERDVLSLLPHIIFLLLWWFALLAQVSLSLLYVLRCFFHFHLVKAEFLNHVAVNYLYTPWISLLLLLQAAPESVHHAFGIISFTVLYWVSAVPVLILDVKIYGRWFTTQKRFLSIFANPSSQISVIGNFVVTRAAAHMGWKEGAIGMFSLGMVHYMVLFITLYQHLSSSSRFPTILRPSLFLFFAAPSMGSLAWNSITGAFDVTCKMLFFLALFLFISLACRPVLFKKAMRKFNVAWWAYSFTTTFLALAALRYAQEVKAEVAVVLQLALTSLSLLVSLVLMVLTAAKVNRLLHEDDPLLNFINNSKSKTSALPKVEETVNGQK
ncbi:S-type anion channel SLAH4-like [Mangifera indica]|uniref:S-type anion channel SLAH4-like n=1 Tax=Mangifera indica TaxID=29780 RepID=UPI001CFBD295|nr:S-type anion channel SLAH4-like [Mangifera indica]